MFELVVREASRGTYDLSSLTVLGVGGAFTPPELALRAEQVLQAYVVIGYGSTELAGGVISTRLGDPPELRRATVGRVNAGGAAVILDEQGSALPHNQSGELAYRGPGRAKYFDEEAIHDLGAWYRTGDLAVIDDQGFIRVLGRIDDLITINATKLNPLDIENVIRAETGVVDVAVVGRPAGARGEEIVVYLVLKTNTWGPSDESMLRRKIVDVVGQSFVPKEFRIVKELPRTADGKISRAALRKLQAEVPRGV